MTESRLANKKPVSAETRAKISASRKGKKLSPEICAKMSAGRKNKRAVVCLESGEVFESITAAAKWANVTMRTLSSVLHKRSVSAGGYHWRYAGENFENANINLLPPRRKRPVRCVETGEIFPSERSAAKWLRVDCKTITAALNKPTHTAGNYHWCDVNATMNAENISYPKDRFHAVKCVETEQIFPSVSAAARWANTSSGNIRRAIQKISRTVRGYHWTDA